MALSDNASQALFTTLITERLDCAKVHSPTLAIYAKIFLDVRNGDPARLVKNLACERSNLAPFRVESIERVRRELLGVEIVNVSGTHKDFVRVRRLSKVNFRNGGPEEI